jgi:hypothetical protein
LNGTLKRQFGGLKDKRKRTILNGSDENNKDKNVPYYFVLLSV